MNPRTKYHFCVKNFVTQNSIWKRVCLEKIPAFCSFTEDFLDKNANTPKKNLKICLFLFLFYIIKLRYFISMKDFETYVISLLIVILVIIGYMAFQQSQQISKIDRAESRLNTMYKIFESWVPIINKLAKFISVG